MEGRDQFSTSLTERPELLALVQIFAHRPQAWLAEEHWVRFATRSGLPALERIREESAPTRFQRRLSDAVERHFGLEGIDYSSFSESARRFALLDPGLLERLAFAAGLMRTSPSLASAIQRDRVAAIVDQIGEDAYRDAIGRGPLTVGADYEGVPLSDAEVNSGLGDAIKRVGWSSVGEVLAGSPDSILKRVFLKFPAKTASQIKAGLDVAEQESGLAALMIRILRNHVNRRAAACVF